MAFGTECFIGEIKSMLTNKMPAGWVLLDGTPFDKTLYAKLWNAVQGLPCVSQSGNNFTIANMQGRGMVAAGVEVINGISARPLGSQGGEERHTLNDSEMPQHNHTISGTVKPKSLSDEANADDPAGAFMAGDNSGDLIYASSPDGNMGECDVDLTIETNGGGEEHNNMQPFIAVNYIICTGVKA